MRLYQGVGTSILCEFQRRSGCVVSFNKFYRRTIADIASHVSKKAGEKSGNWLNTVDRVELQINAEPSIQLDEATAVNLISMAGCDNIDVQREGAQALANVAKFSANQEKLAQIATVVPLLQKLLGSVDTELCRSGCVFLACMATQDSMKAAIVQSCLDFMVAILGSPMSFETTDCKRQVAMALSLLAGHVKAHASGQVAYNVLKQIHSEKRFGDSSLQQSVVAAYSTLHNAMQ